MFKNNIRMADEQNELDSGNEKAKVEKEIPESEEKQITDKEEETAQQSDASSKEEKKATVDKSQIKDEKSTKTDKSLKKEEKKEDDESKDEDDEEELPPGLLERPLEVEGKREKKKVERLSASMIRSPQEKKKVEIEEGSGTKLGDIEYVEHQLNVTKATDLKGLHRVLFLRAGTNNEIKKNIKQFSGFNHSEDSKEHEKRVASCHKMLTAELKATCLVLGLERSGTKGHLVDRVIDFLMKPEDKGLKVKIKGKKRSPSTGGKSKGAKKTKKTAKKGKAGTSDEEDEEMDEDEEEEDKEEEDKEEKDEEEEHDEEDEEEAEEDEESEDEAPKKKKTKTESKKKPQKKSAKENGKKGKPAPKKKPAGKKPAAVDSDSLSEDEEEEDSEDEPIAKMKKSPPSNDEIKDLVKTLLNGADLEKVTMKTVVKQVYAKYPSFDLSDRKDLIKDTVREVIS